MNEKTTDLEKLKKGATFVWGEMLEILEIKEYSIVKYKVRGESRIAYSCYINKKPIGDSCETLDDALAHCIAQKYEGLNSHADEYFMASLRYLKTKTIRS